jgi:hypothetical protein
MVALALAQLFLSLTRMAPLTCVGAHDPASYYQIARHFARGDGLIDEVLWSFLHPSPSVIRPAGDYWPPGWPLVLGTAMKFLGDSQQSALLIVALLGCCIAPLTYWLARCCQASRPASMLAGLIFLGQGWMANALVVPDVAAIYLLAALLSFCLWHRLRETPAQRVVAGFIAMQPMALRGEGFLVWAALWLAYPNRWTLLGGLLGSLPLTLFNLWWFQAVTPPVRAQLPYLTDYAELYFYLSEPSLSQWLKSQPWKTVASTMATHWTLVWRQLPWPLLLLALSGAARVWRRPMGRASLNWVALCWLVPEILVPLVSSVDRPEKHTSAFLCVLAACSLEPWLSAGRLRTVAALLIACLATCCYWGAPPWRAHTWNWHEWQRPPAYLIESQRSRERLELDRRPLVMSVEPAQLGACLDVPSLGTPVDGQAAIYAAIRDYRPRYLVITADSPLAYFEQETRLQGLPVEERIEVAGASWVKLRW